MVLESDESPVSFEVFNAGGDVNNFTKQMIVDSILEKIPEGNVEYKSVGSDPRNYRVSFNKVNEVLGFVPEFTVEDGIKELIDAFSIGLYSDSIENRDKYGNYNIDY
jgi:nucleoside-diphosphate-sugar epimerase